MKTLTILLPLLLAAPTEARISGRWRQSQPATTQPVVLPAPSSQIVDELVKATNRARMQRGLPSLTIDNALMDGSQQWATHLANTGSFEHDQGNFAENIARGDLSVEGAIVGWLASPGHRANLLNPQWTRLGVGVMPSPKGFLYVQRFLP